MSRRGIATTAATRLGILSLLERLPSRRLLVVLAYHRVMNPRDSLYDPNVIETTPDQLDAQLTMLRKRYQIVAPDEMLDLAANPTKLRGINIGITLDDGYIDNYEIAFPILKSHGVSAAFFVATSFVGTDRLPWWDRIGWMVRHSESSTIAMTYPRPATITLDRDRPEIAIREVLRLLKDGAVDYEQFFADLARATGAAPPASATTPQFFSWEHAREMEAAGMFIGSHSHHHAILSTLPQAEQLEDLVTSRRLLDEHGCKLAHAIAYPVGERGSFSSATIEAVRGAGYRFGFSNFGGANPPDRLDRYNIRRFGLDHSADSTRQLRARIAFAGVTAREPW